MPTTPDPVRPVHDEAAEPSTGSAEPEPGPDPVPEEDAAPAQPTTPTGSPRVRVHPEQTADDTDAGWGERRDESGHDRWLREQRPPHWE